ncbi:DUF6543 domain-containing protein [Pseudomonas sp. SIMBA_077]
MSVSAYPFNCAQALKLLYQSSLDAAQSSGAISRFEHDWLSRALSHEPANPNDPMPVLASSIFLTRYLSRPAQWAGAFLLSSSLPGQTSVFLLTPLGRVQKFTDLEAVRAALELQLDDVQQCESILRFTPVDVRPFLKQAGSLTLRTRTLPEPILTSASQAVSDFFSSSQADTLERLLATPTLRAMIDAQVQIQLVQAFPGQPVDAHNIFRVSASNAAGHSEPAISLSSAALALFVSDHLATDQRYTYTGPFTRNAHETIADVEKRFNRLLTSATEHLTTRMCEAISVFWDQPEGAQPSPHAYCVACLGELFFQQLLMGRQRGDISLHAFEALLSRLASPHEEAGVRVGRLLVSEAAGSEVELAGLHCLYFPGQNNSVYLFGASTGLIKIASRAELPSYVLSQLRSPTTFDDIARYAPQDQHALLAGMVAPTLRIETLMGDMFDDCVHAVRAKQIRDFAYWAGQFQAGRLALAAVDHALDVRALIDPGLLALNTRSRWDSRFVPESVGLSWGSSENRLLEALSLKLPKTQAQTTALLKRWPTPRSFARHLWSVHLNKESQRFMDVTQLWVQVFDADESSPARVPTRTLSLADALLERVTGYHPLPQNPDFLQAGLRHSLDKELRPLRHLSGTKLLTQLDALANGFDRAYEQHLSAFFYTAYTPQAPDTLARHLATLRHVMLHADSRLMTRGTPLETQDKRIISTVLTYPISARRPPLEAFVPDVFEVYLNLGEPPSLAKLTQSLLITERGGQESVNAGRAILWTPLSGFDCFDSVDQCKAYLEGLLLDKSLRWDLLGTVRYDQQAAITAQIDSRSDWAVKGENQWIYVERIDNDFMYQSQVAVIDKVLLDTQYVCRLARDIPLSAQGFEHLARSLLVEGHAGLGLERQLEMANTQQFESALAPWLKDASKADQLAYANLLQRYERVVQNEGSYLHGIPDIEDYARTALNTQLVVDFPQDVVDPDAIEVILDTYLAAPVAIGSTPSFLAASITREVQSLTRFALNGFNRLEGGAVFLRAPKGRVLPLTLDARYVKRLVRKLNIGHAYQTLLSSALAPQTEGAAQRQWQFAEQLVLQTLEQGLRGKLSGSLSATAYGYLKHVIEQPDGLARNPFEGEPLIIRPLELIADIGRTPDLASGIYVVGPQAPHKGPQLLWVMYSEHFSLKEYATEGQLLTDLYTQEPLQALVLQRLPVFERKTYANGGFVEPHLPHSPDSTLQDVWQTPAPVALANRPIIGNLFATLYKDNYRLLLDMAALQSKTSAQADWESFKYVLTLVVSTAIMFVPGKLSVPIVVWQGLGLLREGVSAVKQGEWVESVADFALSLVILATTRHTWRSLTGSIETEPYLEKKPVADLQFQAPPETLVPFRANDVALVDLDRDPLTQIYKDPHSDQHYVDLDSQVFRVYAWRNRWRIYLSESRSGPLIKLNTQQRWEVDVGEPLVGGGSVVSSISGYGTLVANSLTYEIQAIGMNSIQRRFPDKAVRIREAHELASTYLQRTTQSLHNLDAPGGANRRNREYLQHFFGVETLEPVHLEHVHASVDALLERFLHPDLSPLTSPHYVVCRSRFDSPASAFVNRADGARRIYLTQVFFNTVFERSYALTHRYMKTASASFPVNQQMRASFLLHEITHEVLETEDIHYLNPGFPYRDLIDVNQPFGRYLQDLIDEIQKIHSPNIATENLFQELDPETMRWKDMPNGSAKSRVLDIAGAETLDQARLVFRNDPVKRVQLMLANADTLVLLIVHLGRVYPVLP